MESLLKAVLVVVVTEVAKVVVDEIKNRQEYLMFSTILAIWLFGRDVRF